MMKTLLILICVFSISFTSYGQNDSSFFLNEYSVSINSTALSDDNTADRVGFGFGVYRSAMNDQRVNLVFGLEFNQTRQFKESMYTGHYGSDANVSYRINSLSIPFSVRVNFGQKVRFYIEAGVFTDLHLPSTMQGTSFFNAPPPDTSQVYQGGTHFKKKVDLTLGNLGFQAGIGIKIPVSSFHLIIASDYKYGLFDIYDYMDSLQNRYFRFSAGLNF